MKALVLSISLILISIGIMAQSDDQQIPLSYEPQKVLEDWKHWKLGEYSSATTTAIKHFMDEFKVPQSGLFGFNLEDTWYWWISTNSEKIEIYLKRRSDQQD